MLAARHWSEYAELLIAQWESGADNCLPINSHEAWAPLVVALYHNSQELESTTSTQLSALEQHLADQGWERSDAVRRAHQLQASNQVTIGNIVTSMRLISALNWTLCFEEISHCELVLRMDPSGVYPAMDAKSRDTYRHAIERVARRCTGSELDVAPK